MKVKHTWLVLCFNRLDQFITQILESLPDMVIIYVGSNDRINNRINNIDRKGISKRIMDIEKKCFLHGITSSIYIKRQFLQDKTYAKRTRIIMQVITTYSGALT